MAADTAGIHHLGLSVVDAREAADFFIAALGFAEVGGRPDHPAIFVSDGVVMLTLWQAPDPASVRPFDRNRAVGLHHVALRVADPEALDALHHRLADRPDVRVEFPPEPVGPKGNRHMMFRGPSGLRIELIAVAS